MYMMKDWTFKYCPTTPHFKIEWKKTFEEFPWLNDMENCPQNPVFHAEGNVLTHTKLVVEDIVKSEEWRNLGETEQSVLFLSALLHDIGKESCTKIENERIISPNHERKGAMEARIRMWRDFPEPIPFEIREIICNLIKHHCSPMWLVHRNNPEYEVIKLSQSVNMKLLSILARADVSGRICNDKNELLDRIDFFEVMCKENKCFDKAYNFSSTLARHHFLNSENPNLYYEPFDDKQFEVILLSGLPGSGKDTYIKDNLGYLPLISLDRIRKELKIPAKKNQGKVVNQAKNTAKEYLRKKESFVWNATNISKSLRSKLCSLFIEYNAKVKIIYIETAYNTLIERNKNRKDDALPISAINKMISKLEIPEMHEAHDIEYIVNHCQ